MSVSPSVVILTQDELAARCDVSFQKGVSRGRFEERCDQSRAKATEGKAGMAAGTASVRRSTAGTGLRVGEASADLPATSEHMDVTAGETAPLPSDTPTSGDAVREALVAGTASGLLHAAIRATHEPDGHPTELSSALQAWCDQIKSALAATKPEAAPAGEVAWLRAAPEGDTVAFVTCDENDDGAFAVYATPTAIIEREKVATKKTYIKPLRTIVEIDERYADQIRDLLNAAIDGGDR